MGVLIIFQDILDKFLAMSRKKWNIVVQYK